MSLRSIYKAVVVGAGPAGITAVGNLLEKNVKPILWIDDQFKGGRVNKAYREVPSNTKVKLFIDYAEALESFRQIVDTTPSPHAIDILRKMPSDQCCSLSFAADMLLLLTDGLLKHPDVDSHFGRASSASFDSVLNHWNVVAQQSSGDHCNVSVASPLLVFCTGSSPNVQSLPVKIAGSVSLDLDIALTPSLLAKTIPTQPTTIGVIGASHSAILVLMNLYKLATTTHPDLKIKWFTRHALQYAVYMDGWILRDNTGLKGEAAAWARANLEPETFVKSNVSKYVTKIEYQRGNESTIYAEHMPGCDRYVQAIGYTRDPIPTITKKQGETTIRIEPTFDQNTGGFVDVEKKRVPGLYAAGIAFPNQITDPHGNVEHAVGFWKFMMYVKKISASNW